MAHKNYTQCTRNVKNKAGNITTAPQQSSSPMSLRASVEVSYIQINRTSNVDRKP